MKNGPIIKINSEEFQKSFLNAVSIFGKLKQCSFTYLPVFSLSQILRRDGTTGVALVIIIIIIISQFWRVRSRGWGAIYANEA